MSQDLIGKIMAVLCALLWAIAVIFFKKSEKKLKPVALNLYKSIIGTILVGITMLIFRIPFFPQEADIKDYILLFLSGILGITIADTLFLKCLNLIGAGLTAIVDCLYSPFLIILSVFLLSETLQLKDIIGAVLIITSIIIISYKSQYDGISKKKLVIGIILGALAMFMLSVAVIMMKIPMERFSSLWVTEMRLIAAIMTLFLQILFLKERKELLHSIIKLENTKFAFPAAFLGNYLSMIVWITAFKYTDISSAAILNQTNTIFVVILAMFFLREKLTLRKIIATLMALSGSILVITS